MRQEGAVALLRGLLGILNSPCPLLQDQVASRRRGSGSAIWLHSGQVKRIAEASKTKRRTDKMIPELHRAELLAPVVQRRQPWNDPLVGLFLFFFSTFLSGESTCYCPSITCCFRTRRVYDAVGGIDSFDSGPEIARAYSRCFPFPAYSLPQTQGSLRRVRAISLI